MCRAVKVILVRHGETIWNTEGRIHGHSDSSLTKDGILQADKTGERLTELNIGEIYSSDLGRTMQTAAIINEHLNLKITPVSCLRERKYGLLEGVAFSELQSLYPEIREKLYSRNPEYEIPNGESLNIFSERVYDCINHIAENTSFKTILLIIHGGVLECFLYKVIGLKLNVKRKFSLYNSSINIFSLNRGVWELDLWGSIEHLDTSNSLSL
ncbi:MAG TPA: histidine phosphatase family protein [Victivallales bacterium]|nr:histidine phosphatase family protein [Victivallales bacterium]